MDNRKYTLRKRAQQQDETRARIVEATVALHEELGPRNTTVSAIALRAGVQRLTVYRHFPDDAALFQACTSCWLERHPPPPPPAPGAGDDPAHRFRNGLEALYRYYRANERMLVNSLRDVAHVPALQEPMQGFDAYRDVYRDALLRCWTATPRRQKRQLRATVSLLVRFPTWQALREELPDDGQIALLALSWVAAIAAPASH